MRSAVGTLRLRKPRKLPDKRLGSFLVLPIAIVSLIFLVGPIAFGLAMALKRIDSRTLNGAWPFNGLSNLASVLGSPAFVGAFPRTIVLATGTVVLAVTAGLLMALLLREKFAGNSLVQVAVLLPWIVAPVTAGLMWRWLFDGNFGLVNVVGVQLGLLDSKVPWLSLPDVAMGVAIFAESWRSIPLIALLFLARLSNINPAIYAAAKVDGANASRRFWNVTLPSLRTILGVAVVIQTINALQAFDVLFTLTQGGPSGATTVLNLLVYKRAFQDLNLGQAAVLAIIVAILTGLVLALAAAVGWFTIRIRSRRAAI